MGVILFIEQIGFVTNIAEDDQICFIQKFIIGC